MKLEKIPCCFLFPVGASLYFSCSTGLVVSEQSAILSLYPHLTVREMELNGSEMELNGKEME